MFTKKLVILIVGMLILNLALVTPLTTDNVCCYIYGIGAFNIKCCEEYKIIPKEECSIDKNYVGGNKLIVDNSFCGIKEISKIEEPKPITINYSLTKLISFLRIILNFFRLF